MNIDIPNFYMKNRSLKIMDPSFSPFVDFFVKFFQSCGVASMDSVPNDIDPNKAKYNDELAKTKVTKAETIQNRTRKWR